MKHLLEKVQKDINQLISTIAGKLPPALKKFLPAGKNTGNEDSSEAADENPKEDSDQDVSDKTTKVNLKDMKQKLAESSNEDDASSDESKKDEAADGEAQSGPVSEADEARKKRSKLIKNIAMGGLALYIVSEFVFVEEELPPAQEQNVAKSEQANSPKKSKRKNKENTNTDESGQPSVAETTTVPAEQKAPDPVVETPPTEAVSNSDATVPPSPPVADPVETPPPAVEAVVAFEPPPKISAPPDQTAFIPSTGETNSGAVDVGEIPGMNLSNQVPALTESNVSKNDLSSKLEEAVGLENKKNAEEMYAAPPDYLEYGRGLIYNCEGKHWACVNKENFVKCHNNQKWTSKMGKPTQCMTVNVYASNEDCQTIHVYNVNAYVKPDGCEGK